MNEANNVFLGEIKVSTADLAQATASLHSLVCDGGRHYVCFCEANMFVQAHQSPEVVTALNRSSMTFADGILLVIMSRLLGRPLPQRVPGPSLMLAACEQGVAKGYRHFFYGGKEGVAQELAERLGARFPGLIVAGTYSPSFDPPTVEADEKARQMIEAARPHLLWVGLGGAKQVLWMENHLHTLDVPVLLGVGAAFDFHSGHVPWAPPWIRKIGMEWAFRTFTGGRRIFLRNLWCVPHSLLLMLREVWWIGVWGRIFSRHPDPAEIPVTTPVEK